jgi:pyruvate/2-oxoglutarate dehydrogenase complex dihydrolipoamide dehydrogenase (E3) component
VGLLLKRAKVERITGYATLKGKGQMEVAGESGAQTIEAKNILIAVAIPSRCRRGAGRPPEREAIKAEMEQLRTRAVAGEDLNAVLREAYQHLQMIQATAPG